MFFADRLTVRAIEADAITHSKIGKAIFCNTLLLKNGSKKSAARECTSLVRMALRTHELRALPRRRIRRRKIHACARIEQAGRRVEG
jgi:hypothetical protein